MTEREEVLSKRVNALLGKDSTRMSLVDIIEELTTKLEDSNIRSVKMQLWAEWKGKSLVSQRTFIRRVYDYGWTAKMAATTPPAPTRPYDEKEN